MKDYPRIIGMIVLSMIMIIELTIKTIPNKNKKDGGSPFAKLLDGKKMVFICVLTFSILALFTGFMFFSTLHYDGAYVFKDEKSDLNAAIAGGTIPEMGGYVCVRFSVVGKEFHPDGREGTYYPIVIYDESGSDVQEVCAIHVNDSEKALLQKGAIENRASATDAGAMFEYSGSILEINRYYGLYDQTVQDSGMHGKGYKVEKFVIDATVDKADIKNTLYFMGGMMIACIIGVIVICTVWKLRTR